MEQPFHSVRSVPQSRFTPARIAGLVASVALQAGFVFAIISGLAGTLIQKVPDVLKVAVEQEKIIPKPPPPPPPQVDLPPPPVAPPPDINIQVEAAPSPITVSSKPPPPPVVHTAVTTPVSVGRAHVCQQNYPDVSVRLNEQGVTTLSFKVMTDGSVSDVTVSKSSGYSRLDDAAVSCAGKWRYKPQAVDGNPVEAAWQANVQWKLH